MWIPPVPSMTMVVRMFKVPSHLSHRILTQIQGIPLFSCHKVFQLPPALLTQKPSAVLQEAAGLAGK